MYKLDESRENFLRQLQIGGMFELKVFDALSEHAKARDPYSCLFPLHTCKQDTKHNRGSRLIHCSDYNASYKVPDFILCVNGKTYLVEAKLKRTGLYCGTHGVIDTYSIQDYNKVNEYFKTDGVLYVFGDAKTGIIYLAGGPGEQMIISDFANYRNRNGEFTGWHKDKMRPIAHGDLKFCL